jgi:hypothetical protein
MLLRQMMPAPQMPQHQNYGVPVPMPNGHTNNAINALCKNGSGSSANSNNSNGHCQQQHQANGKHTNGRQIGFTKNVI